MEGWGRYFGGKSVDVKSADIEIHCVNLLAIKVMGEIEVEIYSHSSNHIDEYMNEGFDLVITVWDHAKERCLLSPQMRKRCSVFFRILLKRREMKMRSLDNSGM